MKEDLDTILLSVSQNCKGTSEEEQNIFARIIAARSSRILCRLRLLRNSWKKPKESFGGALQRAIEALAVHGESTFIKVAANVITLLKSWTKHQVPLRLENLVTGVWELSRVERLVSLVNGIPNTAMEPSSRRSLLNIVGKVARYREAAQVLHHTAKKYKIARQTRVTIVSVPSIAPDRATSAVVPPSLFMTLQQFNRASSLERICRILEFTVHKAESHFLEQRTKALNGKVHAEVQILLYCDQHEFQLGPRVISSSKDACFLCDHLIRLHGKMHTPRSHGRLYPGWRLPPFPHSNLQQQFADLLEAKVRESIGALISTGRRTLHPDPNESTLSTLVLSSSSGGSHGYVTSGASTESETSAPHRLAHSAQGIQQNFIEYSELPHTPTPTGTSSDDKTSTYSREVHRRQVHDESISTLNNTSLKSALLGHRSDMCQMGPFEVYLEDSDTSTGSIDGGGMHLKVNLITAQEVGTSTASVVDLESLHGESIRQWDDRGCIYLTARGRILKLSLQAR